MSYTIFQKAECLMKTKLLHINIFKHILNLNIKEQISRKLISNRDENANSLICISREIKTTKTKLASKSLNHKVFQTFKKNLTELFYSVKNFLTVLIKFKSAF